MTNFTVLATAKIDGGAYRWIKLPDGSSRIEEWHPGKGWKPGGADIDEMWYTPPVSPAFAARLGIPLSDIRVVRRPTTKSPSANLTEKQLREAIRLGVKLAEEEALFKLTMKAKQVAEHDRRRRGLRLVVDNNKIAPRQA